MSRAHTLWKSLATIQLWIQHLLPESPSLWLCPIRWEIMMKRQPSFWSTSHPWNVQGLGWGVPPEVIPLTGPVTRSAGSTSNLTRSALLKATEQPTLKALETTSVYSALWKNRHQDATAKYLRHAKYKMNQILSHWHKSGTSCFNCRSRESIGTLQVMWPASLLAHKAATWLRHLSHQARCGWLELGLSGLAKLWHDFWPKVHVSCRECLCGLIWFKNVAKKGMKSWNLHSELEPKMFRNEKTTEFVSVRLGSSVSGLHHKPVPLPVELSLTNSWRISGMRQVITLKLSKLTCEVQRRDLTSRPNGWWVPLCAHEKYVFLVDTIVDP